jgi:hypothetical protein
MALNLSDLIISYGILSYLILSYLTDRWLVGWLGRSKQYSVPINITSTEDSYTLCPLEVTESDLI